MDRRPSSKHKGQGWALKLMTSGLLLFLGLAVLDENSFGRVIEAIDSSPCIRTNWESLGNASYDRPIPVIGTASLYDGHYLERLLRSIDYPYERLVVFGLGQDELIVNVTKKLQRDRAGCTEDIIRHYPFNLGCSGAWNRQILLTRNAPWWLLLNGDVAFPEGMLKRLAQYVWKVIEEDKDAAMIMFKFRGSRWMMAAFVVTKDSLRRLGMFDENFYPAWYEDHDWWRRIKMAGMHTINAPEELELIHRDENKVGWFPGLTDASAVGNPSAKAAKATMDRAGNLEYLDTKYVEPENYRTLFNDTSYPVSFWRLDVRRRFNLMFTVGFLRGFFASG
mmetsp:Transcript_14715/g.24348  ORF Transcript_14715/g.24348 Transcript_14715/m.24348 type:complete len:335 (-) Transcript_14715:546-1550(-)